MATGNTPNNDWPKSKADFIEHMQKMIPDNAMVKIEHEITIPSVDNSLHGCLPGSAEHMIRKQSPRTETGRMNVDYEYTI